MTSKDAKQHVRPRVRKATTSSATVVPATTPEVEHVRNKMEQWMGLDEMKSEQKVKSASERMFPSQPSLLVEGERGVVTVPTSTAASTEGSGDDATTNRQDPPKKPKSILKQPKYSSKSPPAQPQQSSTQIISTLETEEMSMEATTRTIPKNKASVFKQERIQERYPREPKRQIQMIPFKDPNSSISVEGYAPLMDRNKQAARQSQEEPQYKQQQQQQQQQPPEAGDDKEEPLVFGSLADMMQVAGNLPSQDLKENPQVVEAELAFSCLSPADYQEGLILQGIEGQEEEEAAKAGGTNGKKDVTFDKQLPAPILSSEGMIAEGYNGPVSDEEYESGEDDGDDVGAGGFFDLMGNDSEEEETIAPPRAFRVLWECLAQLITPESCMFLRRLERETKTNDTSNYLITATPSSDLGASRSNGFIAMLRMYISRSLQELKQPVESRRTVEQRLQGLVLSFNFSRPAAKLDTKHWKALTCVLLEIVLFLDTSIDEANGRVPQRTLPRSVHAVGMTNEEYRYLVKSTIKTFDIPDPVI